VKLALDPQMFYVSSSVYELPDIVASLGYDWMELSPKADFVPFYKYPRIDDAGVKRLKKIASDAGVGIASVLPRVRSGRGPATGCRTRLEAGHPDHCRPGC
jgi:myo-inositol catabolism protein IolH